MEEATSIRAGRSRAPGDGLEEGGRPLHVHRAVVPDLVHRLADSHRRREVDDHVRAREGAFEIVLVPDVSHPQLGVAAQVVGLPLRMHLGQERIQDADPVAVDRSSSTRWEPMKPAPPVTSTVRCFMQCGRRDGPSTDSG